MTSVNSLGSTQITLEFDLNRSLDGAAVDVQARDHAGRAPAAAGHADAADLHQGEPGRPADSLPRRSPRRRCRRGRSTSTPRRASRSASRWSAASRRCRCSAARSTPCTRSSIRTRSPSRQIGINEVEAALAQLERQRADRHDHRPAQGVHAAGDRPADERRRSTSDMIVAYRNGAPVRLERARQHHRRRRGSSGRRRGSTRRDGEQRAITLGIQRQPGTNTIAVADAVKALLPQFQRRAAGQRPHGRALRPLGHDPRVVPRRAVHDGC